MCRVFVPEVTRNKRSHSEYFQDALITINAPNLRYLLLNNYPVRQYDIGDLSSLIESDLSLLYVSYFVTLADQLLKRICGVKTLQLKVEGNKRPDDIPVFLNLTCLKLDCFNGAHLFLYKMLQCAPKLKSLIIIGENWGCAGNWGCAFGNSEALMPNRLTCLESVEYCSFLDCPRDFSIVAYFLKAASALKEMKIKKPRGKAVRKRLLALPRSSATCELVFY